MIVAVCDTNYNFLNAMRTEIAKINSSVVVYCYLTKEQLFSGSKEKFDVVFINTELASESGIEVALELKKILPDMEVVFVTQNCEKYAQMIFYNINLLRPFAYFVKPISRVYMKKIINCLEQEIFKRNIGNLLVKSCCGNNRIVPMMSLLYITHNNRISCLHTKTDEIECRQPIGFFDRQLPDRQFVHISKSCIVNLAEIASNNSGEITLNNREVLYASRNYKVDFEKKFNEYHSMCSIMDMDLVI